MDWPRFQSVIFFITAIIPFFLFLGSGQSLRKEFIRNPPSEGLYISRYSALSLKFLDKLLII